MQDRETLSTSHGRKQKEVINIYSCLPFSRTIMSAQANLAGLYYPNEKEKWNENIPWVPIPVHTIPKELDPVIITNFSNCTKYKVAFNGYLNESSELQQIYSQHADQFKFWSEKCGSNISSTQDVLKFFKTIKMEQEQNKT